MESIINGKLTNHLNKFELLSKFQYGFRKDKSCALQLLKCKNSWAKSLDEKQPLDVIYIDFSKAFDSVSHSKLLIKLKCNGIAGLHLSWITCFLKNRTQKVRIENTISDSIPVTSGVPQGSVLGPTLFLIYVNDLVDEIKHSSISIFADDVKIFNPSNNQVFLQQDLNRLSFWANTWQLKISLPKCSVLHIGRSNLKHAYNIDGYQLPHDCKHIKDLGVHVSHVLS
jgi:ribonuclease P/MRP protein subunit RPP40